VRELSLVASAPRLHTGVMAIVIDRVTHDGLRAMRPPGFDETFDAVVLPHLEAGFRLARWLMRNDQDAEDVVQEASLRALRYFRTFSGGNGRAWFLRIVRNTCHGRRGERGQATDAFDEEHHTGEGPPADPETLLLRAETAAVIGRALRSLPDRSRELLVLRELQGFSYRELADAMRIPMGTVMSSLSRARRALRGALDAELRTASPDPDREASSRA
jgi:RNA polymerase sigma-70 factor, ECF subfamily